MKVHVLSVIKTYCDDELSSEVKVFLDKKEGLTAFDDAHNDYLEGMRALHGDDYHEWMENNLRDELGTDILRYINYIDPESGLEKVFMLEEKEFEGPFVLMLMSDLHNGSGGLDMVTVDIFNTYESAYEAMKSHKEKCVQTFIDDDEQMEFINFDISETSFYVNNDHDYYSGEIRVLEGERFESRGIKTTPGLS